MTVTDAPSVLAGRYLLGGEIGQGGMAVVYRGWDTVLQRDVAVKVLRTVVADPAGRARFRAEGEVLARLDHPGLVRLWDTGDLDGAPYLVMELIEGRTLAQRLRGGPLDPRQVIAVGAALAEILTYVHDHDITHRDVKPGNILLDRQDGLRLADFGVARVPGCTEHTQPGFTMGTAAYISPEQVRGEPATSASDIYALGLVLLEALTGRQVYPGPADAAAMARLTTAPSVAEVPAPLRRLLGGMTAHTPDDRPPAAAVRARLEALLHEPELFAAPVTRPIPVPPGLRTRAERGRRADRAGRSEPGYGLPRPTGSWTPALVPQPRGRSPRGVLAAAVAAALMLPVLTVTTCLLVTGGRNGPVGVPAQNVVQVAVPHAGRAGSRARSQGGPGQVRRIGAAVATRRAGERYVQSKDGAQDR